ncbi:MAG: gamma carbonic anhydrase family protein [Tannerellaceae bacterium]|jgi:carbonic anhydrase/acetyltransferase-like protein (isoleucine patch superfamily)|nr:gamma carbonic anhydrase family protein [Tannerellaceae bacterium]
MATVRPVRGKMPRMGAGCFLAETAALIGDVEMGDECSVWYGAVIRGDVNTIRIGNGVNIQDGAVLHTLYEKSVIEIEDEVSIGHNVTIHGAKIKRGALIGMGSVVLDGAVVGAGAIVAAGSVVLSGTEIPAGAIYAGVPARFVKEVDAVQSAEINGRIARNYRMYASWYEEENNTKINGEQMGFTAFDTGTTG